MKHLMTVLVVFGILLSLSPIGGARALAQESADQSQSIRANRASASAPQDAPMQSGRLTASASPTIALAPTLGHSGQPVTAVGQVVTGTLGVRVVWRYGDATRSGAVVTPDASGQYQAALIVPYDAEPGPVQVCAAVTGAENAAFGCADFTIQAAPSGIVVGAIPPEAVSNLGAAQFKLLDRAGGLAYETALNPDGSFSVANVTPGLYQTAIVGVISPTLETEDVVVQPGRTVTVGLRAMAPIGLGGCSNSITVSGVNLTPSSNQHSAAELDAVGLAEFPPPVNVASAYDFGVYIVGVTLNAQLTVSTQGSDSKEKPPTYTLKSPDGKTSIAGTLTGSNHSFTGSLALGDAKIATSGIWTLTITPQGSNNYCDSAAKTLRFIDDPMKKSLFQSTSATTWNGASQQYEFHGMLPNLGGLLPVKYPDPSWNLPLLGDATNEFSAGLEVRGTMSLDCMMTFTAFNAQAKAKLLGQSVLDKSYTPSVSPGRFNPDDPRSLEIDVKDIKLWSADWNKQVYEGVVASFWGVVTVNADVAVGLHGEVVMNIKLWPLQPGIDLELIPTVTPSLTVRVWVDLLLGVASAGADATASVSLSLPFNIDTTHAPVAYFGDPCARVRVDLSAWARVNILFAKKTWNIGNYSLVNAYKGCGNNPSPNPAPPAPPPPPRLLGTPSMAASPDGGVLVVFVGDAAPNGANPMPKVYAMYKAPGKADWSNITAVALTDGQSMVQDPVVTFADPQNLAYVFWTQTVINSTDESNETNLNKILDHQEIFTTYGYPNAGSINWQTSQQATSDNLSDGRPAVSGDSTGLTLAWVRAKTTPYDRSQTSIVFREKGPSLYDWTPMRTMPDTDNGMHAQVSVARNYYQVSGKFHSSRYIAYTTNADLTDPNNPRRIRVYRVYAAWDPNHIQDLTNFGLPAGAMSPAIQIDFADNPMVAYLFNPTTPAGSSASSADPTAQLYFAMYNPPDGHWYPHAATRSDNTSPIMAEKPSWTVVHSSTNRQAYLVYREFGAPGTNDRVGHIASAIAFTDPADPRNGYLTVYGALPQGPGANWLPAIAQNPIGMNLEICWLEQGSSATQIAALAKLPATSSAARLAVPVMTLDTSGETLRAISIPRKPDSSLDPALLFSARQVAPGSMATITTTVRNLGLEPVSGLEVGLYHDNLGVATLVSTRTLTTTFQPGDALPIAWEVVSGSGQQFYYAVVTGGDSDMGTINNYAYGVLNALAQPRITSVLESYRFVNTLELDWQPEDNPIVAGYRILRATASEGPYELVGEATGTAFADLGLDHDTGYFYKVQAFDVDGLLSVASAPVVAGLAPHRAYLPVIGRD